MTFDIAKLLELAKDRNVLILLLAILVALVAVVIVFRNELREKIGKLKRLGFSIGNWKVDADFEEDLAKVRPQGKSEIFSHSASRPLRSAQKTIDFEKQSARDVVLEAWSALKQSVYNACAARGISLTPATTIEEAIRRLGESDGIDTEIRGLIASLDKLGGQLASSKGFKPDEDAARDYKQVADSLMDWMMSNVFRPPPPPPPPSPPSEPRRATMVGGNFVQPRQGSPTAALVGVSGPVRGQRFSIDKPRYRLGRNPNNDLRITSDDSVSGDHAYLRYEKGDLFLSDQGSLNGTFLNEQRITGAPLMVRHGDRIRLGESVFEVVGTSSVSRSSEEKDEARKAPSDRSIVR
jgi:pSer/pThr/pTyr-binding forkhead associated (FHA) protein